MTKRQLRKIIREEIHKLNEIDSNSLKNKSISELAFIIQDDWKDVHYTAKPYLDAMYSLSSIDDKYMFDSGRDVVARFVSNVGKWKGDVAKSVKKELKRRLKA